MTFLKGKKGLVVGIANDQSIAWGCAKAFHEAGAEQAITWLNDKARKYVEPLAQQVEASITGNLDVTNPDEMKAIFDTIGERWGKLDFLVHSVAFAPKEDLHGRVVDSSRDGFLQAIDISCHSFIRLTRLAEPLMKNGGTVLTMSYLGASEVMPNYGMMGPVKAALESSVKYLAAELGGQGIRVHAISPGPLVTRAASGLAGFDSLVQESIDRSPLHKALNVDDVGPLSAFLVSDGAKAMTGGLLFVDGGYNILN
ncbi:Enoyl-[acyl-carrier-protein] reductase [NADH] [Lampropedia hyalina DSM 16112]|jgi:enoyl-[acyl-carrier protein] reductase I|uniref:Enoyl-[acyl-carrier-protein] reductase [NADH] n=1 Tax=Lampropedia hyalina DSM 16112 TaxID=1122156 RepID=A0A1M4WAE3_9BURK|nr:enoyl-ACP reductase FabI [Lampropedia hyalina]SHE78177.1 Enoyl-[acyl-carrier-protein] reductase [NADH] [Lampropedia hyalina DSM 16112]